MEIEFSYNTKNLIDYVKLMKEYDFTIDELIAMLIALDAFHRDTSAMGVKYYLENRYLFWNTRNGIHFAGCSDDEQYYTRYINVETHEEIGKEELFPKKTS